MFASTSRRALLLGLAAGLAAGCASGSRDGLSELAQPVSSSDVTAHGPEYLDLLEAVFRHQFDHNASGSGRNVDYFFLALDADEDPPPELLERFAGETPEALPVSLAERTFEEGVKHRERGGRGLIFRISSIDWVDEEEAVVEGGYYEAPLSSSGNTYQVERRDGRWVVISDRLNWIS